MTQGKAEATRQTAKFTFKTSSIQNVKIVLASGTVRRYLTELFYKDKRTDLAGGLGRSGTR